MKTNNSNPTQGRSTREYSELEFCYYVGKLAKQTTDTTIADKLYEIRSDIVLQMAKEGVLEHRGFHQVGEYIYSRAYGSDRYRNQKKFYADYYETNDHSYGFHVPRANGRGKGNLGELQNLSKNKNISKLSTTRIEEIKKDPRIADLVRQVEAEQNKVAQEKNKIVAKLVEQGFYTHTIYGKFGDDFAKFAFKILDDEQIELTAVEQDYTWSKNYRYDHKYVGQKIKIESIAI